MANISRAMAMPRDNSPSHRPTRNMASVTQKGCLEYNAITELNKMSKYSLWWWCPRYCSMCRLSNCWFLCMINKDTELETRPILVTAWRSVARMFFCFVLFCFFFVIALQPQTTKHIRGGWSHTDTSEPVDRGVGILQLWTTRTILSVKMDRENCLTLLWPEWAWGSNPIPSDRQSEPLIDCATGSGQECVKSTSV
jgi:hypothetical protein